MTAVELVAALEARGVRFDMAGERLRVRPASELSADELSAVRACRDMIVRLLTSEPDTITSWPDPVCAQCKAKDATTYLAMMPGDDGQPWHLCGRCWNDR